MLIHAYIIVLSLLFSTHTNAKAGRRKGALRQPPELRNWTGKWFPFDPAAMTTTTTTTSTENPPQEHRTRNEHEWAGKWFPFQPNTLNPTIKTTSHEVNAIDGWPEKRFPLGSKSSKPKKAKSDCDDGQRSINIDFDPTDKRHSFNYLCLSKNRTVFKPSLNLEAVITEHVIPPAYVPPVKCLNETISYDAPVPTFGAFRPLPPKYGTYLYLPPQRWLRSVTEGAVVMLYHPCAFSGQVKLLQNTLKSCLYRHVITPSQNLNPERPLALIAWGKVLEMSVVDERAVISFIKSNAKRGPLNVETALQSAGAYQIGLLAEAKLITDLDDTEICGYKEM